MSDHDALWSTSGNSWLTGILLNGTSVVFYLIMYLSKCTKHVTNIYCRRSVWLYMDWKCFRYKKKRTKWVFVTHGFFNCFLPREEYGIQNTNVDYMDKLYLQRQNNRLMVVPTLFASWLTSWFALSNISER